MLPFWLSENYRRCMCIKLSYIRTSPAWSLFLKLSLKDVRGEIDNLVENFSPPADKNVHLPKLFITPSNKIHRKMIRWNRAMMEKALEKLSEFLIRIYLCLFIITSNERRFWWKHVSKQQTLGAPSEAISGSVVFV